MTQKSQPLGVEENVGAKSYEGVETGRHESRGADRAYIWEQVWEIE